MFQTFPGNVNKRGHYHLWWSCKKAKKVWIQIQILIQKILQMKVQLKPEVFFFHRRATRKSHKVGTLCLYVTTAVRLLYAQKGKSLKEWLVNMMELSEMAKLTSLVIEKTIPTFMADWESRIDFFFGIKQEKNHLRHVVFMIEKVSCFVIIL